MVRLEDLDPGLIPALTEMWVDAWRRAYPRIDFERRRDWFADRIQSFLHDGVDVIVAFGGEALAGFVTLDPRSGWIDQMLVATAFQGSAVGRQLIDEAKRRRPSGLSLDVNADNHRAIAFYGKQGFKRTGGRNNEQGAAIDLMAWLPAPGL
jgi:putative acetyltransferase